MLRWTGDTKRVVPRAAMAGLVLAGVAVGAAVASPPSSAGVDEYDGRTWFTVERETGAHALLLNGLSGLIEAEAPLGAAHSGASFADASDEQTLFSGPGGSVGLTDGTHQSAARSGFGRAGGVLVGDQVLAITNASAQLLPADLTGEPVTLPLAPVPTAAAVVDSQGNGWYLASGPSEKRWAVPVRPHRGPGDGTEVDATTVRLVVVDGDV